MVLLQPSYEGGGKGHVSKTLCFLRLQRDQRLTLWYIGKRKQGFLRNHAIPQFTFLTPVGNRCITPCVCVKEPSRAREVIPTAGGLYVHKGSVFCRNIRRNIQRYWILRRICRSISCSANSCLEVGYEGDLSARTRWPRGARLRGGAAAPSRGRRGARTGPRRRRHPHGTLLGPDLDHTGGRAAPVAGHPRPRILRRDRRPGGRGQGRGRGGPGVRTQ